MVSNSTTIPREESETMKARQMAGRALSEGRLILQRGAEGCLNSTSQPPLRLAVAVRLGGGVCPSGPPPLARPYTGRPSPCLGACSPDKLWIPGIMLATVRGEMPGKSQLVSSVSWKCPLSFSSDWSSSVDDFSSTGFSDFWGDRFLWVSCISESREQRQ